MDIGCSSTIVTGRQVQKLNPTKYDVMQCHTQAGNITNNIKVEMNLTLPELSVTNVVTWECYVGDSAKDRCNMILGRYLLT